MKISARVSLPRAIGALRWAVAVGVIAALAFDLHAGVALYRSPGKWAAASGFDAAVSYLSRLPKDALIAAHPDDANAIPLRSYRDVLVNSEIALPIHTAYYTEMKRRTNDSFDLLYATDWKEVDRIAAADGIDVFVLDRTRLLRPNDRPYMQPFQRGNVQRIAAGEKAGFVLLNPPPGRVMFQAGDMTILRLSRGRP